MLFYAVAIGLIAGIISGLLAFCICEWRENRRTFDWHLRHMIAEQSKKMTKEDSWF